MAARKTLFLCVVAAVSALVIASDQSPLQDFCIADPSSSTIVNGVTCMDPKQAHASHFSFSGLHLTAKLSPAGSSVTPVMVGQIPGLNTLGVSLVRIDFAPNGTVVPHYHPRASEIVVVLEGSLLVGFVTSNPDNKLITKVLNKGDVFVFPQGLIHFLQNLGGWNAVAFSGLSSQNPGLVLVANTVFGSKPPVSANILAKAFQTDKATVAKIQAKF